MLRIRAEGRRALKPATYSLRDAGLPEHRALYWFSLLVIIYAVVSFLDDTRGALARQDWPASGLHIAASAALSATLIALAFRRGWLSAFFAGLCSVLGLFHGTTPVVLAVGVALAGAAFRNDRKVTATVVVVFVVEAAVRIALGRTAPLDVLFLRAPLLLLVGAVAWAFGNAVRRRKRAEERVAELARQAEVARQRERSLLARELHDVVAHELTIITMQASLMRMTDEPGQLAEARDEIERTSRTALDELKRLLQVLRTSDLIDESGAAEAREVSVVVQAVAERLRSLEFPVEVSCQVGPMPRSVELAADRVLREATTNIVKHAPEGAPCSIVVREEDRGLRIRVSNADVPGGDVRSRRRLPSTRLGLSGLEERLSILGGTFSASQGDGLWVVEAILPFAPPESEPPDLEPVEAVDRGAEDHPFV